MPLSPGTRLGRYEIHSLLGEGGMGKVYLAQDTTLRRPVAIKILPAEFTVNKDRLHRFEREAEAASSLNHPNILTIYEIGAENGLHFIATEFIDGESLRHHLRSASLDLREVLELGIQVASALTAAHAAGIVHRDIKPENIMLRKDGYVKVLDFGLAKLTERQVARVDTEAPTRAIVNTEPGVVMGTTPYMSPEQTRGLDVDERTDIWSLGVVLYEMVTGHFPFEGETPNDVIAAILKTEPPVLTSYAPDAPAELERIVTKALRKEQEERYQGIKDLGLDLKSLKHRLEFEAELGRTATAEKRGEAERATTSDGGTAIGTTEVAEAQTGSAVGRETRSGVEYIASHGKQHKRRVALALALVLLAIAGLVYFFYFAQSSKAAINSVAVLPFVNVSNDANTEYLSDGISESLINNLSQLPQLKVIARSSTFKYKGKEIDPQAVANALGVQAIVTGRIVLRGDNLQISVEMMDARDRTQMWGEQYNRRAADLQTVQAEIARAISEKLRLRLTGAQEQQLAKRATENPEAYQLYLNGVFYLSKGGLENRRKALDYFNQAIALDPNFALAYSNVAVVYTSFAGSSALDPREAMPKAKAAVQRALELDETLASAHNMLASIKQYEWDWPGAESEYRRAVELNPNFAGSYSRYASYLSNVERHTEALAKIKRAQELDPLLIGFKSREGLILLFARRYDEAQQQLQNALKLEPDYALAHEYLGYTYAAKGMYAQAINEYQKYISLEKETTSVQAYLGYAYAMSGKRDEALAILNKLKTTKEYVSPAELAILYAGLGDKEEALNALERAYAAHDLQLQYLKVEPHYDSLRSDPHFQDLLQRVRLTQ